MCGRLTRIIPLEDIIQAFAITEHACDLGPSDNIAPTQPIAVIQEDSGARRLVPLRWGLIPAWAKEPSIGHRMINARAETLSHKPSFRSAFKQQSLSGLSYKCPKGPVKLQLRHKCSKPALLLTSDAR